MYDMEPSKFESLSLILQNLKNDDKVDVSLSYTDIKTGISTIDYVLLGMLLLNVAVRFM